MLSLLAANWHRQALQGAQDIGWFEAGRRLLRRSVVPEQGMQAATCRSTPVAAK